MSTLSPYGSLAQSYIPLCISTGMWEKNFKFNGTVATLLQDKVVMIFKVLCRMSMRLVLQRTVGNFSYLTKKLFFYSQKVQRSNHRKVQPIQSCYLKIHQNKKKYFSMNIILPFDVLTFIPFVKSKMSFYLVRFILSIDQRFLEI